VISTILHILHSSRHVDPLSVDIDDALSAEAAPPARFTAQCAAHGPDRSPGDWD
jgi:hypothetical protein